MIKKIIVTVMIGMILITNTTIANASDRPIDDKQPLADIYKEGIYHFSESAGKNLVLKLETPNKPMIVMIIENNTRSLKYYIEFTQESPKVEISLTKPIAEHTTIMVGDGEISFTYD